jgi:hypothetical protein
MGKEIHHASRLPREHESADLTILGEHRGILANTATGNSSCVFIPRVKP